MGTALFIFGLILLALACFTMEVITPSFGLLTLGGAAAMVWAIIQCFAVSSVLGWIMIPVLLAVSVGYMVTMVKLLPNSKLAGRLVLGEVSRRAGDAAPRAARLEHLVGKQGTAETTLRPGGTVRIDKVRYDAVAESGLIARGRPVKVLRARGSDVVVAEIHEPLEPQPGRGQAPEDVDKQTESQTQQ